MSITQNTKRALVVQIELNNELGVKCRVLVT